MFHHTLSKNMNSGIKNEAQFLIRAKYSKQKGKWGQADSQGELIIIFVNVLAKFSKKI